MGVKVGMGSTGAVVGAFPNEGRQPLDNKATNNDKGMRKGVFFIGILTPHYL